MTVNIVNTNIICLRYYVTSHCQSYILHIGNVYVNTLWLQKASFTIIMYIFSMNT